MLLSILIITNYYDVRKRGLMYKFKNEWMTRRCFFGMRGTGLLQYSSNSVRSIAAEKNKKKWK